MFLSCVSKQIMCFPICLLMVVFVCCGSMGLDGWMAGLGLEVGDAISYVFFFCLLSPLKLLWLWLGFGFVMCFLIVLLMAVFV